jgi:hypothetical protein
MKNPGLDPVSNGPDRSTIKKIFKISAIIEGSYVP